MTYSKTYKEDNSMKVNIDKIRGLMAENHDTNETLGKKIGVSAATVSNYLNGKTDMTVALLGRVAQAYNVDAFTLLAQNK